MSKNGYFYRMKEIPFSKPTIESMIFPGGNNSTSIFVLRDDRVHPYLSGNKWRKLKYNITEFKESGKKIIVTFGGAYSNHLVATAAAGKIYHFPVLAIVRGDQVENERLQFIRECGTDLHFISRSNYRLKSDDSYIQQLLSQLIQKKLISDPNEIFLIPEGGSNLAAVKGTEEILDDLPDEIDYIITACGSGGTIAGISRKLKSHQRVFGISVLKGGAFLIEEIKKLGGNTDKINLLTDFHFGGYAKSTPELLEFCNSFSAETGITIEPVYTGKVFFAVRQLLKTNLFQNKKVAIIHTGGIFKP